MCRAAVGHHQGHSAALSILTRKSGEHEHRASANPMGESRGRTLYNRTGRTGRERNSMESSPEELTYERWETPVSMAKSLALVSLWQDPGLNLVVEDLKDPERNRYRITFPHFAAYKNTLEEYLIGE